MNKIFLSLPLFALLAACGGNNNPADGSAAADTTVITLANTLRAFSQFPDEFQRVKSDPSLVKAAFEESLRWDSPSRVNSDPRSSNTSPPKQTWAICKSPKSVSSARASIA